MDNEKMLKQLHLENLIDATEISNEEYEKLKESNSENVFQVYTSDDGGTIRYMKTTGITDKTKTGIQYHTYKCIKTIKNIALTYFILSIIGAASYLLMTLLNT